MIFEKVFDQKWLEDHFKRTDMLVNEPFINVSIGKLMFMEYVVYIKHRVGSYATRTRPKIFLYSKKYPNRTINIRINQSIPLLVEGAVVELIRGIITNNVGWTPYKEPVHFIANEYKNDVGLRSEEKAVLSLHSYYDVLDQLLENVGETGVLEHINKMRYERIKNIELPPPPKYDYSNVIELSSIKEVTHVMDEKLKERIALYG